MNRESVISEVLTIAGSRIIDEILRACVERRRGIPELQRNIEDTIVEGMLEFGPDGHCDGADKIAEMVYERHFSYVVSPPEKTED